MKQQRILDSVITTVLVVASLTVPVILLAADSQNRATADLGILCVLTLSNLGNALLLLRIAQNTDRDRKPAAESNEKRADGLDNEGGHRG